MTETQSMMRLTDSYTTSAEDISPPMMMNWSSEVSQSPKCCCHCSLTCWGSNREEPTQQSARCFLQRVTHFAHHIASGYCFSNTLSNMLTWQCVCPSDKVAEYYNSIRYRVNAPGVQAQWKCGWPFTERRSCSGTWQTRRRPEHLVETSARFLTLLL